jgi:pyruvate kinase
VLTGDGTAARLVSKYRPPCPVVVVSDNEAVLRGLAGYFALYPCKVRSVQDGLRAKQWFPFPPHEIRLS